jgi:hypothetical protein
LVLISGVGEGGEKKEKKGKNVDLSELERSSSVFWIHSVFEKCMYPDILFGSLLGWRRSNDATARSFCCPTRPFALEFTRLMTGTSEAV